MVGWRAAAFPPFGSYPNQNFKRAWPVPRSMRPIRLARNIEIALFACRSATTATMYQYHRVPGRDAVELGVVRQPLLAQLGLVPVRVGNDELAGGRALRARLDRGQQLGHRAHLGEIDAGSAAGVVQMAVDQALE